MKKVLTGTANEILGEYHYYPFGMRLGYAWMDDAGLDNRYQFNGIERQEDFGLNLDLAEFRSYDAAVGRWLQVDPLAEVAPSLSPYRFGFNNPINFVDPLGLFETRKEVKDYRRENNLRGKIRKNSDGRFDLRFKGSDGYVTRTIEGSYEYGAVGSGPTIYSRPPEMGTWESDMYFSRMTESGSYIWLYRGSGEPYVAPANVAEGVGRKFDGIGMLRIAPPRVSPTPKIVKHHIFNKFRGRSPSSQKYRDFFRRHGINVDDHTVEIPESLHKKMHEAGNNWTTQWKSWIDSNPHASTKEVYQQTGKMMDDYGISSYPIVPYK